MRARSPPHVGLPSLPQLSLTEHNCRRKPGPHRACQRARQRLIQDWKAPRLKTVTTARAAVLLLHLPRRNCAIFAFLIP